MTYFIVTMIILALLAVFVVFQRLKAKDNQMRLLAMKGKRMLAHTEEVFEIIENASQYENTPEIMDALLGYYVHLIRLRDTTIDSNDADTYVARADEFKGRLANIQLKTSLNSDAEIAQAKRSVSQAAKLLRGAQKKNIISQSSFNAMRTILLKRILELEVSAYERLGDLAGEKNDPAKAANHYKYAKKLLIESDLKYPEKNDHVREISDKAQILFGNAVQDHLSKETDAEGDTHDEFGIPKDLNEMTGKKKRY